MKPFVRPKLPRRAPPRKRLHVLLPRRLLPRRGLQPRRQPVKPRPLRRRLSRRGLQPRRQLVKPRPLRRRLSRRGLQPRRQLVKPRLPRRGLRRRGLQLSRQLVRQQQLRSQLLQLSRRPLPQPRQARRPGSTSPPSGRPRRLNRNPRQSTRRPPSHPGSHRCRRSSCRPSRRSSSRPSHRSSSRSGGNPGPPRRLRKRTRQGLRSTPTPTGGKGHARSHVSRQSCWRVVAVGPQNAMPGGTWHTVCPGPCGSGQGTPSGGLHTVCPGMPIVEEGGGGPSLYKPRTY
mmetsp:Transcript_33390/g.59835  ORF Transcript_33390/g.59835 Transcript_33390/m.59835 type:complete len:287 (-) Transcript_33390:104-964(-)